MPVVVFSNSSLEVTLSGQGAQVSTPGDQASVPWESCMT